MANDTTGRRLRNRPDLRRDNDVYEEKKVKTFCGTQEKRLD